MTDYLKELNNEQKEAAMYTEGALLILAGAGSGKTRTMTHRIAYLIDQGVSPYSILAVTFTNKAAKEMRDRVELLVGNTRGMWIQTFHSACVRILRAEAEKIGYKSTFAIYDTADQKAVAKAVVKELEADEKKFTPAYVLSCISDAKNKGLDPGRFAAGFSDSHDRRVMADIFEQYEITLKKNNAMDFDDLLVNTVKLFEKNPDVQFQYSNKFEYIMVDEYQDTNMLQYRLIKMLADVHKNICVVGDDDQCIYQWRGADIRNILEFEKDFPGAKVIKLERNYRSSSNIINGAHSVIVKNHRRKDKKMRTEAAPGDKIEYYRAQDDREEARWIVDKIRKLMRDDERLHFSDFAILYRNNVQSRRFEDAFSVKDVPYQVLSGLRYYDRKEIKDMLSYMRLIINPDDDFSLLRILNEPKRGIGKTSEGKIQSLAKIKNISMMQALKDPDVLGGLSGKAEANVRAFTDLYDSLALEKDRMSVAEIYDVLLERTGYIKALEDQANVEAEARIENLLEFKTVILEKENEAVGSPEALTLEKFLEDLALIADIDNKDDTKDAVSMMTLHSAKGLEFPVVFMPGMETGLFPGYRSFDKPDGIEEERRLCYVGMTRAKSKLFMSSAELRTLYGRTDAASESQFLKEIEKSYMTGDPIYQKKTTTADRYSPTRTYSGGEKYVSPIQMVQQMRAAAPKKQTLEGVDIKAGDKVDHRKFGEGVVLEVDGNVITVKFEEGVKNLAKDLAPLTKVE